MGPQNRVELEAQLRGLTVDVRNEFSQVEDRYDAFDLVVRSTVVMLTVNSTSCGSRHVAG